MWGALFRQVAIFLFTRRGKRIAAFIGIILLGFTTALLLDSKMYLSAAFSGVMTVAALFTFILQYFRQRAGERVRLQRKAEEQVERAAVAQARSEKRERAKEKMTTAAKAATGTAASMAGLAKTRVARARNRMKGWRAKRD